ncbi:MAG: SocA family protein [Desulfamplus sp.]|nr:SocA family protein [Desulfamplus sp.]
MESAFTIADCFLRLSDEEELLCNMKLQKLLYYAQGLHLALYNEPLFNERIFAWTHGPVVAEVYYKYKNFGIAGIPAPKGKEHKKLSDKIEELITEVFIVYGQFSAWKLRELTHEEPPWNETTIGEEIEHSKLRAYFLTQLQTA